jgi:geranylgeranyl reductase
MVTNSGVKRSSASLRTKVLVIGGGPAGSTAARVLAENNVDTVLVEKDFSFVKPCGGGIPSGAFEELDLPYAPVKKQIRKIKMVSPSGRTVEVNLKGGFIAMVERGQFDSILRQKAEDAGAELLQGRFRRFLEIGRQIISEVIVGDSPVRITSDYVIAADGINSRALVSAGVTPPMACYVITQRLESPLTDSCEFWFGSEHAPGFYSWVFPHGEYVSTGTGGFRIKGLRALHENFLKRRQLPAGDSLRGYKVPLWGSNVFNKGRILFAGDAAGQVMPLTFEGIYYAMKAAQFAAEAVIRDKPSEYKKLWKKRFHTRFSLMKRLWRYFLKDDASMEKFVSICERPYVQEASMRLWLNKKADKGALLSYINIFRKFIV